jgi:hypothetical protein
MKLAICLLISSLLVLALPAGAQIGPQEDHFKVYTTLNVYGYDAQVSLIDQFGESSADTLFLDHFATPVEKNQEPMFDPDRHLTWWKLPADPQPGRRVVLENQFGNQTWMVYDGEYLLVPALKNGIGELLPHNHYKCYDARGPAVDFPVYLVDQFGGVDVVATIPVFFCNPVTKVTPSGFVYDIVDPQAHLAVYWIDPSISYGINALAMDQFGEWDLFLEQHEWLCVPSYKIEAVGTEKISWGRIKALY